MNLAETQVSAEFLHTSSVFCTASPHSKPFSNVVLVFVFRRWRYVTQLAVADRVYGLAQWKWLQAFCGVLVGPLILQLCFHVHFVCLEFVEVISLPKNDLLKRLDGKHS